MRDKILNNIGHSDRAFFLSKDLTTGETPMFNPLDQCFYYVDIEAGDIHQYDPSTQNLQKWHLDKGMVGGLVINHDGSLLGNSQDGLFAFNPSNSALVMLGPIEPHKPNNRPNDMGIFEMADGSSRIAIGCIPIDRTILNPEEKPGVVYIVQPDTLGMKAIWDNHVTSNALCGYSDKGKNIIFYAETDKNNDPKIWKAHYDPQSDKIVNPEIFLTRKDFFEGRPDGAHLIDIDGQSVLAVACLDTNKIIGYDTKTAEPVMMLESPPDLTLTHAAYGPDGKGDYIALITSRWQKKDGHEMKGAAVIVPLKSEFNIRSFMPVARDYPSFEELTDDRSVEILQAQKIELYAHISSDPSPDLPEL